MALVDYKNELAGGILPVREQGSVPPRFLFSPISRFLLLSSPLWAMTHTLGLISFSGLDWIVCAFYCEYPPDLLVLLEEGV